MKNAKSLVDRDIEVADKLYKRKEYTKAAYLYSRVIEQVPRHANSLDKLRRIALKQSRYSDALALTEELMSITPSPSPNNYFDLGYVLNKVRRVEDSLAAYHKGIELDPQSPDAYHKLAHVYRVNGRFAEAEAAYAKVLELDPNYISSYYPYSNLHTFTQDDPLIQTVGELIQDKDIQGHDRIRLLFTMGKIQDDLGNYSEAFSYYKTANTMVAEDEPFDTVAHDEEVKNLITSWKHTKTLPEDMRPKMIHIPIFIIGLSRSGKSMTEWMLAKHPDISSAREGNEWYTAINSVFPEGSEQEWIGETLQKLNDQQKSEIGTQFQKMANMECIQSPYIIHSMPFGYWYVGLMLEVFPNAKIIHCVRDPMDNIWASYCKYYQTRNGYAYDLDKLTDFLRSYLNIMNHWKQLYGDRILTIQYEEMCSNPDQALKMILEYCQIKYEQPAHLNLSTQYIGKYLNYKNFLRDVIDKISQF